MKLLFEKSKPGRKMSILPPLDVEPCGIEDEYARASSLDLPEMAEIDISRHYTALANRMYGVNNGFYPLGSCTMKYNPKVNEEAAALRGFTGIHPLQPEHTVQGCLEVLHESEKLLCEVTGMDAMSFQPAAGAHGEFAGLLLIKAYHHSRNDIRRTKIIVPDSAHGTNPASAAMAGFDVISVRSGADGCVDIEALRLAVGEDTAGLMLTNPNTLGIFEKDILEITDIIHTAGGLNYYDGANLNAIVGIARPGDMGFDVIHLNLHKTFSTPHGGGGPGSGPVGCKAVLAPFLPSPHVRMEDGRYTLYNPAGTIGRMRSFHGNFLVVVKALTYILMLGGDGLREVAQNAVLNANYMMQKLRDLYPMASGEICMHEFVMSLSKLKAETGVTALDVAKSLQDMGMHPPTMYFPLIVDEALMVEPTETESKETLDEAIDAFRMLWTRAYEDSQSMKDAPLHAAIRRPDEVAAARKPKLMYSK